MVSDYAKNDPLVVTRETIYYINNPKPHYCPREIISLSTQKVGNNFILLNRSHCYFVHLGVRSQHSFTYLFQTNFELLIFCPQFYLIENIARSSKVRNVNKKHNIHPFDSFPVFLEKVSLV